MSAPLPAPRKRFGQNFLHDPAVVERILAAVDPGRGEHVVEIGPGRGALTDGLAGRAGRLTMIELDRDLAAALRERYRGRDTVRVVEADALTFDLAGIADERRLRVVGNLPYNISTPLVFRLLDQADLIADMHFMLQREVVERMTAAPGGRAWGRLGIMVQLRCRAEPLFRVGAGAFVPAPRVDSGFVRLVPLERPAVAVDDPRALARLVSLLFSKRRKTLRNILRGVLDAAAIEAAGCAPSARPETLGLERLAALSNAIEAPGRGGPERAGDTHRFCG